MARQFVKTYQDKVSVEKGRQVMTSTTYQVNQDLRDNPEWYITHLVYFHNGEACTVVFNIEDEIEVHDEDSFHHSLDIVKEEFARKDNYYGKKNE